MDDLLHLTFLGVGNAGALDLGNSSAVLETSSGSPLLLTDCGPTVLPAFASRYSRLPDTIFITICISIISVVWKISSSASPAEQIGHRKCAYSFHLLSSIVYTSNWPMMPVDWPKAA
ncbi:MAG: hypothetical protein WBN68_11615 [Sedimenticolaceae bacterium]